MSADLPSACAYTRHPGHERLDGSNKYDAEEYGPQDADAGTLYLSFPPILTLHPGTVQGSCYSPSAPP